MYCIHVPVKHLGFCTVDKQNLLAKAGITHELLNCIHDDLTVIFYWTYSIEYIFFYQFQKYYLYNIPLCWYY